MKIINAAVVPADDCINYRLELLYSELSGEAAKVVKCERFICSNGFCKLSGAASALLLKQLKCQKKYIKILSKRIALFEKENCIFVKDCG